MIKLNSLYFENGYDFYKFIDMFSTCVDECKISIRENGFFIKSIDPSRICLFMASGNCYYEKDQDVCINLDDFSKVLRVKKSLNKSFTILFEDDKLLIEKEFVKTYDTHKTIKTLNYIDTDIEDVPIKTLMGLSYTSKFKMTKKINEFPVMLRIRKYPK